MRAPKMWPYRLLGLESDASLAQARAAHARLCARCGSTPLEQGRRARYDAALAWCLEHWLDGGPAGSATESSCSPNAGPRAPATPSTAAVPAVLPPCAPSEPPKPAPVAPTSFAPNSSLVCRAIKAYRAAQAACAASPVVRVWKA